MRHLRGNYILSLNKPKTTSYGLSSFFYVSAKMRNALPDFIRTTEFTGFKVENLRTHFVQRLFFLINTVIFKYCVFSYVPVYAMYFSCKCNVWKILSLVVILKHACMFVCYL